MNLVRIHIVFSQTLETYDICLDDTSFALAKEYGFEQFDETDWQADNPKLYDLTALLLKARIPTPEPWFVEIRDDPKTLKAQDQWNVVDTVPPFQQVHSIGLFLF